MSQPSNQREYFPVLGELDRDAGEFWMENPWKEDGNNLSAYERNRVLLNLGNAHFIDASHITGGDFDSDSRGVVCEDFTGDGMPDVIVRSSGGGPLKLLKNRFPQRNWLKVSLRGRESNRLGIGTKVSLTAAGQLMSRSLFPANSFATHRPHRLEFGLGDGDVISEITVKWMSGKSFTYKGLPANRHFEFDENGEYREN